jgi:hypothetical protein
LPQEVEPLSAFVRPRREPQGQRERSEKAAERHPAARRRQPEGGTRAQHEQSGRHREHARARQREQREAGAADGDEAVTEGGLPAPLLESAIHEIQRERQRQGQQLRERVGMALRREHTRHAGEHDGRAPAQRVEAEELREAVADRHPDAEQRARERRARLCRVAAQRARREEQHDERRRREQSREAALGTQQRRARADRDERRDGRGGPRRQHACDDGVADARAARSRCQQATREEQQRRGLDQRELGELEGLGGRGAEDHGHGEQAEPQQAPAPLGSKASRDSTGGCCQRLDSSGSPGRESLLRRLPMRNKVLVLAALWLVAGFLSVEPARIPAAPLPQSRVAQLAVGGLAVIVSPVGALVGCGGGTSPSPARRRPRSSANPLKPNPARELH